VTAIERAGYRVETQGAVAYLTSPSGEPWLALRLLAALDTVDAPDETLDTETRVEGDAIVVERRSTVWEHARTTLVCHADALELRTAVAGRRTLSSARLLGGRSLIRGQPTGFLPSGSTFRRLFSPNPGDPEKVIRSAGEAAVIGVAGDGSPGRGHWFFTPAPLYFALSHDEREWLGLTLAAPVEQLSFVELVYRPADRGFSLEVDYEGHTRVDGAFEAPRVFLSPGEPDPYEGLRRHRSRLSGLGHAPEQSDLAGPGWWNDPIFCGWGAQCRLAALDGAAAAAFATQANYDTFLDHLEGHGVVPNTVVIDDKWQDAYGTNRPDTAKWPDLAGWIADRHARGQHVLLWWKAWDPEGLSPELCIRNPEGVPIAFDPGNPAAAEHLREGITQMLAPSGLDADGLKIDFTARTPSGRALTAHGQSWGIALLHELLGVVYAAAKQAKPDALLITQTPHPSFVDVTDMIRLNDMIRMRDADPATNVVAQMRFRAAVARAVCPELPIDTDDWCVPNLAEWREYLEVKPSLGIPSLYYADSVDATGESFEPADYEALRTTWERWRTTHS
jgi:hypothetical protein